MFDRNLGYQRFVSCILKYAPGSKDDRHHIPPRPLDLWRENSISALHTSRHLTKLCFCRCTGFCDFYVLPPTPCKLTPPEAFDINRAISQPTEAGKKRNVSHAWPAVKAVGVGVGRGLSRSILLALWLVANQQAAPDCWVEVRLNGGKANATVKVSHTVLRSAILSYDPSQCNVSPGRTCRIETSMARLLGRQTHRLSA